MKTARNQHLNVEICILAGGLSTRMGQDKSHLRLGQRTMLGHIRATARQLGFSVRAIRRDKVRRSGPIGGIYTALRSSKADAVLFLACDMPFVSADLLQRMIRKLPLSRNAHFASEGGLAGFPCFLRCENCLPLVSLQIAKSEFSLQALAKALRAKMLQPARPGSPELTNVNTPSELEAARQRITHAKPIPPRRGKHERRSTGA
jgi:molybdopterin-guanine dinucleotide biosynthesis protein A